MEKKIKNYVFFYGGIFHHFELEHGSIEKAVAACDAYRKETGYPFFSLGLAKFLSKFCADLVASQEASNGR